MDESISQINLQEKENNSKHIDKEVYFIVKI